MPRATTRRGTVLRSTAVRVGLVALALLLVTPTAANATAPVRAAGVTCATSAPAPTAGGVDMSATIVGPTTSPCDPTPAPSTGGNGSGGGSTGSGSTGGTTGYGSNGSGTGGSTTTDSSTQPPTVAVDEINLGGILNVGGLTSSYQPSFDPFGGALQLAFTVRNVSTTTIDSTADFWMEGPFGNRISAIDGVEISGLKPGELRTISAELPGVGQWTVLSAHARLTPPDEVEGTTLTPLTRDTTAFALPWLIVLLLALAGAAWAVLAVLRRREPNLDPAGALA